jgi:hypothetical protein
MPFYCKNTFNNIFPIIIVIKKKKTVRSLKVKGIFEKKETDEPDKKLEFP